jgi:DNA-binding transcriptional LysR family regulator
MPNLRRTLPSGNALFVFEAAARCGSFTRAAEELYVSQPAVSRMLARMEDHIGVLLFERTRGSVVLTESGRILYREIAEGFGGIERAIREIKTLSSGLETVELSVSTAFTTHWLMPRMHLFQAEFPNVSLRFGLIPGRIRGSLGDADLGMRLRHHSEGGSDSIALMRETLLPVCNPDYLKRSDTPDTLIVLDDVELGWQHQFASFAQGRRCVSNTLRFNDYGIVLQAALLGRGIALGWLNVVSHWLTQGALAPVGDDMITTERSCFLVHPEHTPMRPVVARIRDWIIAESEREMRELKRSHPRLFEHRALESA